MATQKKQSTYAKQREEITQLKLELELANEAVRAHKQSLETAGVRIEELEQGLAAVKAAKPPKPTSEEILIALAQDGLDNMEGLSDDLKFVAMYYFREVINANGSTIFSVPMLPKGYQIVFNVEINKREKSVVLEITMKDKEQRSVARFTTTKA